MRNEMVMIGKRNMAAPSHGDRGLASSAAPRATSPAKPKLMSNWMHDPDAPMGRSLPPNPTLDATIDAILAKAPRKG